MTELKSVVWSVFICRHQSQRAEHRKHDEVRTWAWTRTRTRTSSGGSDVFSSSQLMTSCWCHSAVTLAVWGEPQWAHSDCGVLISALSSVWQARQNVLWSDWLMATFDSAPAEKPPPVCEATVTTQNVHMCRVTVDPTVTDTQNFSFVLWSQSRFNFMLNCQLKDVNHVFRVWHVCSFTNSLNRKSAILNIVLLQILVMSLPVVCSGSSVISLLYWLLIFQRKEDLRASSLHDGQSGCRSADSDHPEEERGGGGARWVTAPQLSSDWLNRLQIHWMFFINRQDVNRSIPSDIRHHETWSPAHQSHDQKSSNQKNLWD